MTTLDDAHEAHRRLAVAAVAAQAAADTHKREDAAHILAHVLNRPVDPLHLTHGGTAWPEGTKGWVLIEQDAAFLATRNMVGDPAVVVAFPCPSCGWLSSDRLSRTLADIATQHGRFLKHHGREHPVRSFFFRHSSLYRLFSDNE